MLAAAAASLGLVAGAVAGPTVASANTDRVVLSVGHTDAVAVFYENGQLHARVNDDTGPPPAVIREPDEVLFHAKPESMVALPPPGELHPNWEFLREVGDPLWILPQTQDYDLLWPGWSSEEIPLGGPFVDNELTWTLREVRGAGEDPAPGEFALYIDGLVTNEILFNTTDGLPDGTTMRTATHAHFNWAFGAEGLYRFVFEVEGELVGGGHVSTGPVEYWFFVGDLADLPDDPDQPGPPASPLTFKLGGAAIAGKKRVRLRGLRLNRAARVRASVHSGPRRAARRGKRRVARAKPRRVASGARKVNLPINRRLSRGRYWVRVEATAGNRSVTRLARVRVR